MSEHSLFEARDALTSGSAARRGPVDLDEADFARDLKILQSMAEALSVTLRTLEPSPVLPLSYSFEGRYGREHRMIIYAPRELLLPETLRFVGFVSLRSQTADPQVVEEIFHMDHQMLAEIAHVPGLLSYSSLEREPGNWYNLVVFRDIAVKTHITGSGMHRHASQDLSPAYYEWIRLHNGSMPGGLIRQELCLSSTRYYRFSGAHRPLAVHEKAYEECTGA